MRPDEDNTTSAVVESTRAVKPLDWSRSDWWICLGLVVISLLLVGIHTKAYPTLSPLDELQHIDYAMKASEFAVPRSGDRVGQEAMIEAACRNVDAPNYLGPECGLKIYDPNDFQERGFNTATPQFPIYYTITGILAKALTLPGSIDSFVTAARLVGGLWLGIGWAVTWLAMTIAGISRRQRGAATALLIAAPMMVFHSATVGTDASLFLTGAIALMSTMLVDSRRMRPGWLVPIFVALYFVEATVVLTLTVGVVYLGARHLLSRGIRTRRDLLLISIPLAAIAAIALLRIEIGPWVHDQLYPSRPSTPGVSAPMFEGRAPVPITAELLLGQLHGVFTPVAYPYVAPPWRSPYTFALIHLVNWFAIMALGATSVFSVASRRMALLGGITVLALLAAGPFYTFYYAYFGDLFYEAPARFGLPLMSCVIVAIAAALTSRLTQLVAVVLGVATLVNAFVELI